MRFAIVRAEGRPPGEERVEIVERKGLGHPDSICDALAEELCLELSRFYLEHAGRILHHNVDKALLVGGVSRTHFGGGEVLEPIRIFLAGRATLAFDGVTVPVAEIAEHAARRWFEQHLHALDAHRHVVVSTLVRPGSADLVDLFDAQRGEQRVLANDTSCGVGYAPLSEVERVVLAVEGQLNTAAARAAEPAFGEDVKVMAVRCDDRVQLTIARAMVDAALRDLTDYAKAAERAAELVLETAAEVTSLPVTVGVNAADDLGAGRVYLTVTGTSAEAGDDGQAGRGNRVNGLIAPGRPMTMESVAGKNPVSHVGKLYNLAAGLAAERIVASLPTVLGAECRMISRIGHPIEEPDLVEARLTGVDPEHEPELAREVERILREELAHLPNLAAELVSGDVRLDRWPLRRSIALTGNVERTR
jgi:S-adenosylmethionine synthetase